MNRDSAHIAYILESISLIQGLLADGCTRQRYDNDWLVREVVLLSDEVKNACPAIAWHKIKAFRNALAHGYRAELDDDLVWLTIEQQLTPLKDALEQYQFNNIKR